MNPPNRETQSAEASRPGSPRAVFLKPSRWSLAFWAGLYLGCLVAVALGVVWLSRLLHA